MQSLLLSSSATIAYTNHASNANQMLRWKWAKINLAPLLLGKAAPSLPSRRNLYLDVEITCVFSAADFLHMEEVLQNGRKPEKHTFSLLLKLSNWTFFLSPIPRILWVCTVHTSINGFSALFYGHTLRFHLSRYDFFGRHASLTPLVRLPSLVYSGATHIYYFLAQGPYFLLLSSRVHISYGVA